MKARLGEAWREMSGIFSGLINLRAWWWDLGCSVLSRGGTGELWYCSSVLTEGKPKGQLWRHCILSCSEEFPEVED